MSNPFLFEGNDSTNVTDFGSAGVSSVGSGPVVKPPMLILAIAGLEVILTALAFVPASSAIHWMGYFTGCVIVSVTVFMFRRVDRTRQTSDLYAAPSWVRKAPSSLLACAVALALLHAFYLATSKHLA